MLLGSYSQYISANLQPLENAIRQEFIPAILNGYLCNDLERRLFSLPAKYGGLAIFNPTERCIIEYANSRKVTAGMVQLVCDQSIIWLPDKTPQDKTPQTKPPKTKPPETKPPKTKTFKTKTPKTKPPKF